MANISICFTFTLFWTFVLQTVSESGSHDVKRLLEEQSTTDLKIAGLTQNINQLRDMVTSLSRTGPGAVFTRWGRTVCPNNTHLVYSGYTGGSDYTHTGGAANYLCLPSDPSAGEKTTFPYTNIIYGAEFESSDFGSHAQNQDVPCAVCRSPVATSSLMIPARDTCYPGWSVAYNGRLAAGYYGHAAASEYVCVDMTPEYEVHGEADANGKLFYPVTSHCGSLPCPPYHEHSELHCVVCLM